MTTSLAGMRPALVATLAAAAVAATPLLPLTPPAGAVEARADGWTAMVRDHGARLEGCVVSAPGERTQGWVLKLRGDNTQGRHGHRFGASLTKGGPEGNRTSLWRVSVDRGDVSRAAKVRLPRAGDWLGVGMEDYDGTGGVGTAYPPDQLRSC